MSIQRVKRSKNDARQNYDALAPWYDWLAGSSEKKYLDMGLEMLAARAGETALEIGPGTGNGILALAESVGERGHVFGLDLSQRMLAQTRRRVGKSGLDARINLLCGDGAYLPVKSACVDVLLMSFTLELFDSPEIPQVLTECQRVLHPGGRICAVALSREPSSPEARGIGWPVQLYEWCHERWPSAVDCRPIYAEQALADAGFVVIQIRREMMWGLPVEIVLAER